MKSNEMFSKFKPGEAFPKKPSYANYNPRSSGLSDMGTNNGAERSSSENNVGRQTSA